MVAPVNVDEDSCLERKSMFDTSESYCSWVLNEASVMGNFHCVYVEPSFTWQALVLSAMVVAILTALFNVPMDMVFDLIHAPTADEMKVRNDESSLVNRVGRRMSNVAENAAKTIRRASAILSNATAAAVGRKRDVQAGEMTRFIPDATHHAHGLATQSIGIIQPVLLQNQLKRLHGRESVYTRAASSRKNGGLSVTGGSKGINSSTDLSKMPIEAQSMAKYKNLCQDILLQRQLLRPSDVANFDTQWSLATDENDELNNYSIDRVEHMEGMSASQIKNGMTPVEQCVLGEIVNTKTEACQITKDLRYATDEHIGLEILHYFILDILGKDTPAAKIFLSKTHEDFNHTYVVTKTLKVVLLIFIGMLDLFFLYFALLRSYERGAAFQRRYVMACVAQFFIEIFIFETVETLCIHFLVPNLVSKQVTDISASLKRSMDLVLSSGDTDHAGNRVSRYNMLDVTQYMYTSTLLAKEHPTLLESHIISAYHTHLPGELAKKWQHVNIHASTSYYHELLMNHQLHSSSSSRFTVIKFALFNMLLSVALFYGASPVVFQRVILTVGQPLLLAAFTAGAYLLYKQLTAFLVVVGVIVMACCYWFYKYQTEKASVGVSASSKTAVVIPMNIDQMNEEDFIILDLDVEEDDESSSDSDDSDDNDDDSGDAEGNSSSSNRSSTSGSASGANDSSVASVSNPNDRYNIADGTDMKSPFADNDDFHIDLMRMSSSVSSASDKRWRGTTAKGCDNQYHIDDALSSSDERWRGVDAVDIEHISPGVNNHNNHSSNSYSSELSSNSSSNGSSSIFSSGSSSDSSARSSSGQSLSDVDSSSISSSSLSEEQEDHSCSDSSSKT